LTVIGGVPIQKIGGKEAEKIIVSKVSRLCVFAFFNVLPSACFCAFLCV
jgi:hypothetical protein